MRACPGKRQRRGLNGVLRCHKIDLDTLNYLGNYPSPHIHIYNIYNATYILYIVGVKHSIHTYIYTYTRICITYIHISYTYIHVAIYTTYRLYYIT